ncbi:MAG: hypothetical protein IPF52_15870 [Saprospiraceae bacterium]|nr:hypothetical protein [Saprospiraceae bacterium]
MEKLISRQLLAKVRTENLNESVRLFSEAKKQRERAKYSYETSVFLSHKHSEKDIIQEAITLLEKLGVFVYVDWMDSEMPKIRMVTQQQELKKKLNKMINLSFLPQKQLLTQNGAIGN